jgi:hypothetical protein
VKYRISKRGPTLTVTLVTTKLYCTFTSYLGVKCQPIRWLVRHHEWVQGLQGDINKADKLWLFMPSPFSEAVIFVHSNTQNMDLILDDKGKNTGVEHQEFQSFVRDQLRKIPSPW